MNELIGKMVMVYYDPIDKLHPEGEAILIEPVKFGNDDDLSIWMVQFKDEPEYNYQRTIDKKDIIKE